jgi:hypothetical protein
MKKNCTFVECSQALSVLKHEGLVEEKAGPGLDEELGGEGAVEERHHDGRAHESHTPPHLRWRGAARGHLHEVAVLLTQCLHPCVYDDTI